MPKLSPKLSTKMTSTKVVHEVSTYHRQNCITMSAELSTNNVRQIVHQIVHQIIAKSLPKLSTKLSTKMTKVSTNRRQNCHQNCPPNCPPTMSTESPKLSSKLSTKLSTVHCSLTRLDVNCPEKCKKSEPVLSQEIKSHFDAWNENDFVVIHTRSDRKQRSLSGPQL